MSRKQLFWGVLLLVVIIATVFVVVKIIQGARESAQYSEDCLKTAPEKIDPVTGDRYKECYGEVEILGPAPEPKNLEKINFLPFLPTLSVPFKFRAAPEQQKLVAYVWILSKKNKKIIKTIEKESKWNPHQRELIVKKDKKGKKHLVAKGHGYGLCQVDDRYWKDHAKLPSGKTFHWDIYKKNPRYQARTCVDMIEGGVRVYGADKAEEATPKFWWPPTKLKEEGV